jgi:hypothetical protein
VFPYHPRLPGVIFHTVDTAQQFIERAKTTTGLRDGADAGQGVPNGAQIHRRFKQNMKIL